MPIAANAKPLANKMYLATAARAPMSDVWSGWKMGPIIGLVSHCPVTRVAMAESITLARKYLSHSSKATVVEKLALMFAAQVTK